MPGGTRSWIRRSAETVDGHDEDAEDDRAQSVEPPAHERRGSESGIQAGQNDHDAKGRYHKAQTRQNAAAPPATVAQEDAQLGRRRPRHQVHERQAFHELVLRDPPALLLQLRCMMPMIAGPP